MFGRGTFGGVYTQSENDDVPKDGEHWSRKPLPSLTERDYRIMREDLDIVVRSGKVPPPIRSWDESNLPKELVSTLKSLNYKTPMQIQYQAIPVGLMKQDMIATAPTGSGKTLAYLIPLIKYLSELPEMTLDMAENGPRSIILSPTRELAIQIGEDFHSLCTGFVDFRFSIIVGGVLQ